MDALDEGMAELYVDEDYVNYPNCQLPVREFRRGTDPTEYMEAIQRRLKSLVERKKRLKIKNNKRAEKYFGLFNILEHMPKRREVHALRCDFCVPYVSGDSCECPYFCKERMLAFRLVAWIRRCKLVLWRIDNK